MLSGDNGILQKATDAKTQTGIGQEKEIVALAYNSALAKKVSNGDSSVVTAVDLNPELANQGATAIDRNNQITVTFTASKRQYTINSNGTIEYADIKEEDINIELSINPTGTQKTTPTIPNGFYYVGGTVNSGYVISDNANDENKYASNTNVGTDLQGNQFVWIPVAQNQKITLKVKSKENITSIKLYDPYNDEISIGSVSGKTYNNMEINPTINGLYKVEVTTTNETKNEYLVVRSLYAKSTFYEKIPQEPTSEQITQYSSDEFINEMISNSPSELGINSKEDVFQYFGNMMNKTITTNEEFGKAYAEMMINYADDEDFSFLKTWTDSEDYTNSVSTNGGFYVGRYEAGTDDGNLVIKANQTVWNNVSFTNALALAQSYDDNKSEITSSLLTGSSWDRTLEWLIQTGNKTLSQINEDSSSWGIWDNNNSLKITAFSEKTKANNIYDLSGNVSEWTSQMNDVNAPVQRGGYENGCIKAYSMTGDWPNSEYDYVGFRIALYL